MISKGITEPSNFKLGSVQISKICKGLVTLWENWKSWSASGRNPSSGYSDYSLNYTYTYSVPSNVKVKSIGLTAYCQKVNEENLVNAIIKVYYNGAWHKVSEGGASGDASYTSWTNSNDYKITQIQFIAGGLTLPKALSWSISGIQTGEYAKKTFNVDRDNQSYTYTFDKVIKPLHIKGSGKIDQKDWLNKDCFVKIEINYEKSGWVEVFYKSAWLYADDVLEWSVDKDLTVNEGATAYRFTKESRSSSGGHNQTIYFTEWLEKGK